MRALGNTAVARLASARPVSAAAQTERDGFAYCYGAAAATVVGRIIKYTTPTVALSAAGSKTTACH